MLESRDQINNVLQSLDTQIDSATTKALAAFMGRLEGIPLPKQSDVNAATSAAIRVLRTEMLSNDWLMRLCGGHNPSEDELTRCRSAYAAIIRDPEVPLPQDASRASPLHLTIAAAAGAVFGMMVFTPLMHWLLDMRDTGLFIGAPAGAALVVWASHAAAENKWVKRTLMAALAVATAAEAISLFWSSSGIVGKLWQGLGGRRSSIKRIAVFLCVLLVLYFSKRIPAIDRVGYKTTVSMIFRQWITNTVSILTMCARSSKTALQDSAFENQLLKLVGKINDIRLVDRSLVDCAVEELILETRNMGFGIDYVQQTFIWTDAHESEYEAFGHIESGDTVIVERMPLKHRDVLKRRGLARRFRERDNA